MNKTQRHSTIAILVATISLGLAACGTDEAAGETLPEPVAEQPDADLPIDEPVQEPANPGTELPTEEPSDEPSAGGETPDGTVLGTANINGVIVDPKPHAIDGIAILESYPEQLEIAFTAGAEPCLAASAEATVLDGEVVVSLEVGITEDALTKSCVAALFEHTMIIPLSEGLDGREVRVAL